LLTTGCYDPKAVQAFLLQHKQSVSGVEYHVYPPDVLAISSITVPEIAGQTERVRPDGKINLPLLGEVFVAGMTPKERLATISAGREVHWTPPAAMLPPRTLPRARPATSARDAHSFPI